MSESLSFSVYKLWQKRKLHINTDFSVTGCMLCVIPHISKDAKYHSYSYHRKQVNNIINTLFSRSSEEEIAVTLDLFWTEYTVFDNMIGFFDADEKLQVFVVCWTCCATTSPSSPFLGPGATLANAREQARLGSGSILGLGEPSIL